MKRLAIFLYGLVCYAAGVATLLYAAGFLGNFGVPKSIDSGREVPLGTALLTDLVLFAIFAIQHSVMARPGFKRAWTRIVPEAAERSTYVLFSSLALIVLFIYWQPLGGVIWNITSPEGKFAIYAAYAFGWALLLFVTFLINHFDLFGLRQIWLYLVDRPYQSLAFRTPSLYRIVRHPLYIGWFFVVWATPTMTLAHLLFALGSTVYILFAIPFEERDLMTFHPEYSDYRRRVPMLVPFLKRRQAEPKRATARG